jgi:plasmid segregation protein ParM
MSIDVRSVDVGYGNTKYISGVGAGSVRCAHFASVAPCSPQDPSATIGGRRKTVTLQIDGLFYEVGPDAHLAADVFQTRHMHDSYCETPEYLALLRGALSYMKLPKIDLLVVGLPVSTFKAKRQFLERRLRGEHRLSDTKVATVERVKVVAQPQGALMQYGLTHNKLADINSANNLVIDLGARTFDWLVAKGTRIMEKRSGSANRGMFDVLHCVAEGLSREHQTNYRDYDRLDVALRTKKKPKVFGQECDLAKHLPAARKIADDAVNEMLRSVGDGNDIDNIILVGGAAFFYSDAIRHAFPRHQVQELSDPMYANVRGFQAAGMAMVQDVIESTDAEAITTT